MKERGDTGHRPVRMIGEAIGLTGVILSLVFVGIEIRQNTMAVQAATIQAIADQANELNIALATDEHLPRLVGLMFDDALDPATMDIADRTRLELMIMAGLRRVENVYLQVQAGILDESAFRRIGFPFYETPFARIYWARAKENFDPDFVSWFDGHIGPDPSG